MVFVKTVAFEASTTFVVLFGKIVVLNESDLDVVLTVVVSVSLEDILSEVFDEDVVKLLVVL